MLLGLMALVWLGRASEARASCGYYVGIGHPSAVAGGGVGGMGHWQMRLEKRNCPCDGPQCRGQDRPMTPPAGVSVSVQDPMAMMMGDGGSGEMDLSTALIDESSFLSDPHIWRIDPPPRF